MIDKKNNYILLYFLGNKPDNLVFEPGADVIDLLDEKNPWYTSGPNTFVELIDKASVVYTDSFHATVFSLMFHTPFIVFNRVHTNKSDMSGRIKTLLDISGIKAELSVMSHIINYPTEESDKNISVQRKKSIDFLRKSLESTEI